MANSTFKDYLVFIILEVGKKDWVDALSNIIETINTTCSSGLSSYIILYKVWFGRPPMWLGFYTNTPIIASSLIVIVEVDDNSDDLLSLEDDVDPDYVLLELYCRVLVHNAKEVEKMVYKGGEKLIYKAG